MRSPTPSLLSEDFTIRPLTSADIPRIRDVHSTLLPVNYPLSFFLQLLCQPSRLCLVAHSPSCPNAPVAFVSAFLQPPSPISQSLQIKSPQIKSPSNNFPIDALTTSATPQSKFDHSEPRIEILTLGVLPPYRHSGLARHLIQTVVLNLRESLTSHPLSSLHSDGTLVSAHVSASNAPAHRFYERIGLTLSSEVVQNMYRTLPYGSRDAYLVVGRIR